MPSGRRVRQLVCGRASKGRLPDRPVHETDHAPVVDRRIEGTAYGRSISRCGGPRDRNWTRQRTSVLRVELAVLDAQAAAPHRGVQRPPYALGRATSASSSASFSVANCRHRSDGGTSAPKPWNSGDGYPSLFRGVPGLIRRARWWRTSELDVRHRLILRALMERDIAPRRIARIVRRSV